MNDDEELCTTCGDPADEHDAAEFGGGCGVCGDCPGYEFAALDSGVTP